MNCKTKRSYDTLEYIIVGTNDYNSNKVVSDNVNKWQMKIVILFTKKINLNN